MDDNGFAAFVRGLGEDTVNSATWGHSFVEALTVDGASVATFGPVLAGETVSATDETAARLDELQFDLGEGPCWDALSSLKPELHSDVRRGSPRWPVFRAALAGDPVGGLFSFPLFVGPLRLGAIDLYTRSPHVLSRKDADRALVLARTTSRLVLLRALRISARDNADPDATVFPRRVVHQATGMVLAQLRVPPEDAYLVIQGHAFASGRSMEDVAADIVGGTLRFSSTEEGIQDHP